MYVATTMSAGAGHEPATAAGTAEPATRVFLLSAPEMSMVSAMLYGVPAVSFRQ
jgi:hypothetical protein